MSEAGIPHLAERLDALFVRVPRPGTEAPWSNDAVAEELSDRGVSVTAPYLSQLRSGKRTNPSARLLAGIADFFGVPLTYFFDDDEHKRVASQLENLAAARDARLSGVLARTHTLSDQSLSELTGIIEAVLRLQNQQGGSQDDASSSPPPGDDR